MGYARSWKLTRRPLRARASRGTIKDRVSIHERPPSVADRSEVGHWERDLIICQRTRPVLVLHERKTRVTLAARLTGKSAAETASVIMAIFRRLDPIRVWQEHVRLARRYTKWNVRIVTSFREVRDMLT